MSIRDGQVLASAHNCCEEAGDFTAHAELACLRAGALSIGPYLNDCTLYCTLEPCMMCAGAAVHARLKRIVFGAFEPHTGCCGSVADICDGWFFHTVQAVGGVLEDECAAMLQSFFQSRREEV